MPNFIDSLLHLDLDSLKNRANDFVDKAMCLYVSMSLERYGIDPKDVVCVSRVTQKLGDYKPSEYRGTFVVVGTNGSTEVRRIGDTWTDHIGEWTDIQLLPDQTGLRVTKVSGDKETYTSTDKEFINSLVKSWAHKERIEE